MYIKSLIPIALAAALASAQGAAAQTLNFTGTRENVTPLTAPGTGRCAPTYFTTLQIAPGALSSTGMSNISNFTAAQSVCVTSIPPTPLIDGQFTYTFEAGDTIFGTYSGSAAASGTPGTFTATENLVILGGTGRFIGASGTLVTTGPLRIANGNSIFDGTVNGSLTAPTTTASGLFATALGVPSAATGDYATAVGAFAYAPGLRSSAFGSFAEATGPGSTAIGDNSLASGPASIALGQNAAATAPAAAALGHNSVASAIASTAVGVRATAAFAGSTAIGANATTTAANQVALGGAGSAVRVGDIAASTAAQQASSVGVATVDANGVLGRNVNIIPTLASQGASIASQGTAIASQGAAIGALQQDTASLFDLTEVNRRGIREANEGVAMALALDSPNIPAGARFAVSGGVGYFKNRMALATAVSLAVGEMSSVSAGFGYGFNSREVGARAGFQLAW